MSNVDTIVLQSLVERLFANAGASPEVAGTVARVERGATSNAPLGRELARWFCGHGSQYRGEHSQTEDPLQPVAAPRRLNGRRWGVAACKPAGASAFRRPSNRTQKDPP